jgi:hypothetical protein
MGPNEGKTYLEQTKCTARALMSLSPKNMGDPITDQHLRLNYEIKHGALTGKWVKHIHSYAEAYVYIGDPLEEGGKTCAVLPEGVEIATTFDYRPTENGLLKRFEDALSQLEDTIDHVSLIEEVNNLKHTLEACQSGYNERKIAEFRNWIKHAPETTTFPNNPHLLAVNPNLLTAFCHHLAEERAKYCSDALLFGSVATTVDICNYCASKVQETTREDLKNKSPIDIVISLSLFLTSEDPTDKQTDPVQILAGTTKKAINWGFVPQLFDICNKYRDIVEDKIELALNSETTDESFNNLYEAIPYAFATKTILANLINNPDKIGNSLKKAKGAFEMVDERLVRLHFAITQQVIDFFGDDWKKFKAIISMSRAEFGESYAEKYVDWIIEENLFYPRRFKTALLNKN